MFSLGNGVTVALQTLTLPVGVRIPVPQPKKNTLLFIKSVFFFYPSRRLGISLNVYLANGEAYIRISSAPSGLYLITR